MTVSSLLAPVGVSTYKRLNHLQQTIAALSRNNLAKQTKLFIFSDAPKVGDENAVADVREYIKSIQGFSDVTVMERESNSRVENNRGGMNYLLDQFGKMIYLEEDVVSAPGFLTFMNDALDKYGDQPNILSISGYCPPNIVSKSFSKDTFLLMRFNAWGFGITKEKFKCVQSISKNEIISVEHNRAQRKRFQRKIGADALIMAGRDAFHVFDAFDVKAMFSQFKNDMYTVYPRRSLTLNIGNDGSGIHCNTDSRFDVSLWNRMSFALPARPAEVPEIERRHSNFRKISFHRWLQYKLFRTKIMPSWVTRLSPGRLFNR
jgi:hypothetical protein